MSATTYARQLPLFKAKGLQPLTTRNKNIGSKNFEWQNKICVTLKMYNSSKNDYGFRHVWLIMRFVENLIHAKKYTLEAVILRNVITKLTWGEEILIYSPMTCSFCKYIHFVIQTVMYIVQATLRQVQLHNANLLHVLCDNLNQIHWFDSVCLDKFFYVVFKNWLFQSCKGLCARKTFKNIKIPFVTLLQCVHQWQKHSCSYRRVARKSNPFVLLDTYQRLTYIQ